MAWRRIRIAMRIVAPSKRTRPLRINSRTIATASRVCVSGFPYATPCSGPTCALRSAIAFSRAPPAALRPAETLGFLSAAADPVRTGVADHGKRGRAVRAPRSAVSQSVACQQVPVGRGP